MSAFQDVVRFSLFGQGDYERMNFEIFRDETSGKAVGVASTGPAFNAERSDPSARLF